MNKFAFLVVVFIVPNIVFSQCDGRYQTEIFSSCSNVSRYTDIHDWDFLNPGLKMDVYTPDGDTFTQRPLIILLMEVYL